MKQVDEQYLIDISNKWREEQKEQIAIGKTDYNATVAALHAQAGFMAGYRRAIVDIRKKTIVYKK